MAMELARSTQELKQMPLVELAWEILKFKKEPYYFRDLMKEIQALRGMSEDEVMEVIARLYTEINIDGRFVCIGHNVWGLRRWYPVDKGPEKSLSGKRFVRRSGDGFSDDDEDLDDFDDPETEEAELDDDVAFVEDPDVEAEEEEDEEADLVVEDEDEVFADEDTDEDSEELLEDEDGEDLDEDEED